MNIRAPLCSVCSSRGCLITGAAGTKIYCTHKANDNNQITSNTFKFNINAIEYVPLNIKSFNIYDIEKEEFRDQTLPWNTIQNNVKSYSYFCNTYSMKDKFDSGGQAEVYRCTIISKNNRKCMVKVYKFLHNSQKLRIFQEYMMVKKLHCAYYFDICYGKNKNELYLIMETLQITIPAMIFMKHNNNIYNFNYNPNGLNIKYLIIEIASFLHSMHRSGYIHLDIKPSNCMLRNTGAEKSVTHGNGFKLIDFGSTKYISDVHNGYINLDRFHGTFGFNAPEMKRNASKENPNIISKKTDIFSFGILLLYVINGGNNIFLSKYVQKNKKSFMYFDKLIENGNNFNEKIADIIKENYLTKLFHEGKINTKLKMLLSNMLRYNQENRLSALDIVTCPFFVQYVKIICGNKVMYVLKALKGRYCSPKFIKKKYYQLF